MITFLKRFGVGAVLVTSLATVRPALGQNFIPGVSPFFQIRPGLNVSQAAFNLGLQGRALQNFPPYAFPGGGWGNGFGGLGGGLGYGGGYGGYLTSYYDPSPGNTLRGSAELTKAQGEFIIDQQRTLTMREQRRGEKLKNDRTKFDLETYMREHTPSAEELRLRNLKERVMRSRNNPPVTEITSAKALNDLLQDINSMQARGDTAQLRTFSTPLNEDTLKHVNVTKGQGNIGLLKNEGRLTWPVALSSIDFKEDRERINSLVRDAVSQAGFNGQVDSGSISQLITDTDRMRTRLRKTGTDLPPSLYIDANVFLNNLDDAIRALQQPDVGSFFTGKYALKAKTIPELVNYMTAHGLQFAPAVPGDESAYLALQQALAAYDRAVNPNIEKEVAAKR
ncbi:MAG TPA: hypothetical protein VGY66_05350 [Gemmataceae bacterium]|jgi:hypothetical protein|nr:hypothetical protein [Gemmataceae bacterium]